MQLSRTLFAAFCTLLTFSAQNVAGLAMPAQGQNPQNSVQNPGQNPVHTEVSGPKQTPVVESPVSSSECPQKVINYLKPLSDGSGFDTTYTSFPPKLATPLKDCINNTLCKVTDQGTCIKGLVTDFHSKGKSSPIVDCVCKANPEIN